MTRKQAVLADVTAAREEARRHLADLSFGLREKFYDTEAALDTVELRLQCGHDVTTESLLKEAQRLAQDLLRITARAAA
jgi:hypothetical protein